MVYAVFGMGQFWIDLVVMDVAAAEIVEVEVDTGFAVAVAVAVEDSFGVDVSVDDDLEVE